MQGWKINNYYANIQYICLAQKQYQSELMTACNRFRIKQKAIFVTASRYQISIWDPYTAGDSNKLDKVQRQAARFVRRDYQRTTSGSQLISKLSWQSLAERRKTSRLMLLYKAINGFVAILMDELEHTSRCTRHCGPNAFIILQSRVDAYKFSFFPRTVSDWNSLPSSARSTPSVNSFKTALHRLSGITNSHHWAMALQQ